MKLDRFINRPVLSTVISILIVILGILGLISLPISQYPDIAPPTVRVSTPWLSAEDTEPIEGLGDWVVQRFRIRNFFDLILSFQNLVYTLH